MNLVKTVFIVLAVFVSMRLLVVGLDKSIELATRKTPEQEFVSSCNSDGNNAVYCQCMWNELIKRHTLTSINKDALTLTDEQLVSKYRYEFAQCIDFYNYSEVQSI